MKQLLPLGLLIIFLASLYFPSRVFAPPRDRHFQMNLPTRLDGWREAVNNAEKLKLGQVDDVLRSQPLEILDRLVHNQIVLSPRVENWLAYEALENLARILESEPDHKKVLAALQRAHGLTRRLKCDMLPSLVLSMRQLKEADYQRLTLGQATRSFEFQEDDKARSLGKELLTSRGLPAQMRSAVENLVLAIDHREALTRLDTALASEANKTNSTEPVTSSWKTLDPAHLPPTLQRAAAAVRGLRILQKETSTLWNQSPDLVELHRALDEFRFGQDDGVLAVQVQQNLAVKALLEGFPKAARELLPDHGSREHAASLVHDLRTLILGSGGPLTAFLAPPGAGASQPFLGLFDLLSSASRTNWHPPSVSTGRANDPFHDIVENQVPLWLASLKDHKTQAEQDCQHQRERTGGLLTAAVNQSLLDEKDNQDLIKKLVIEGFPRLTLVEKALALELKREKWEFDKTVEYLRYLPNCLNRIDP